MTVSPQPDTPPPLHDRSDRTRRRPGEPSARASQPTDLAGPPKVKVPHHLAATSTSNAPTTATVSRSVFRWAYRSRIAE